MKTLMVIAMISVVTVTADARPRNQCREVRQDARIQQGAQSGQLTDKEQAKLNRVQARIDRAQDKAAADGTVTYHEKMKLEKMQDRQSKRIYRQKHDDQKEGVAVNTTQSAE